MCIRKLSRIEVNLDFKSPNGGTGTIPAGELFEFTVDGCFNPPTTKPTAGFTFVAVNQNNFRINSYSATKTITTTTAATITTASLDVGS